MSEGDKYTNRMLSDTDSQTSCLMPCGIIPNFPVLFFDSYSLSSGRYICLSAFFVLALQMSSKAYISVVRRLHKVIQMAKRKKAKPARQICVYCGRNVLRTAITRDHVIALGILRIQILLLKGGRCRLAVHAIMNIPSSSRIASFELPIALTPNVRNLRAYMSVRSDRSIQHKHLQSVTGNIGRQRKSGL